jgi:nitrogen-specific signal transduction histidine kinase
MTDKFSEKQAAELVIAKKELAFQEVEKANRAAELVIANVELAFQNVEKANRAAELVIANKELVFQNKEKAKRAAELVIANKALVFQNKEKAKRAAELVIAKKELAFQNKEKAKRAAELVIAKKELAFQEVEKANRAAELVIANVELVFQNVEKANRAAELVIANKELAFQNKEKEKRAAELVIAKLIKQDYEDKKILFNLYPNAILTIDDNGKVSHINPAFQRLFKVQDVEIIGLTEVMLDQLIQAKCVHPDQYLATSNAPINANLIAKQCDSVVTNDELDFEINVDGIKVIARSYVDCNITPISRIIYYHDITDITLVDRMKSAFIATAAHELRTPMTSIFGYAELLNTTDFDAETQKEMIALIYAQSKAMMNLLNEVLDMAKMEAQVSGVYLMTPQPIGPILKALVETLVTLDNRNKVVLEMSPNLPEVNVDKIKIEQAVRNLLSNAFKFSPNHEPIHMQVTEVMQNKQRKVLIAIQDHGIGMTPEQLTHMYERFYRVDRTGNIPGTGLGMAIVKDIITHHGGTIEIESKLGAGTKVMVYLPVA